MMQDTTIWETYRQNGLHVFPTKDKRPTVSSWKSLPDQITFNGEGAMACGELSGNVEALDIDAKNDPALFDKLQKALIDFNVLLPEDFVFQTTPSGGAHMIYRTSITEGNQILAKTKEGKVLIETRGHGGYVCISPTPGYQVKQGTFTAIPFFTDEEREALFAACRSLNEYWPQVNTPKNKIHSNGLTPWDDYNSRADVPDLLQSHGWTFLKSVGNNDHYCRPEKKGATSATWNESLRLFYVFTSSTQFEPGQAYTPSAVFTYLECGKDFAEAGRKLRAMGYGEQYQKNEKLPISKNLFRLTKPTSMERPKKIFGTLWAHGENAFLFAEDGAGKSILATQIGCAIATGESIAGFQNELPPQPVALFDTELSDFQFNTRYPQGLPDNFKRFTFDEDAQKQLIGSTVDFIVEQIEGAANSINAKILILDNLSALASMLDLVKTKDSIHLMGLLNDLKKKNFSVLIVDHTRKPLRENDFKTISKHDLQGSKMKTNLVDSVFSIGKSAQGNSIRYIKGLKIRSFEMSFAKDAVATMEIKSNPLRLEFLGIDPEWQHVKDRTSEMLKMVAEGKTQAEIAQTFNVSQQAISKILNNGL